MDFETAVGRRWRQGAAITARFGLTATTYYQQQLNALFNVRAALEYSLVLVNRLRRLRQSRQRSHGAAP